MHVVVVGATGNVGTAVLRALRSHEAVRSVLGVARRPPPQARGVHGATRARRGRVALDMAPLMDTTKARRDLGWSETRSSVDALTELLDGIGDGSGGDTPALARAASGTIRFDDGDRRYGDDNHPGCP